MAVYRKQAGLAPGFVLVAGALADPLATMVPT